MAQNLIGKLRGRGRKRKAGVAKRRQKVGKKPRLTKRDNYSYGASVSLSPPTMSVSLSSEFDVFASRLIQTSIVETTEVSYKPIASAEQSDLEFLIPADNGTYVDLNIKLYIRGKSIKVNGTNMDNTDFTAVTKNYLHSLFSQCSIALNGWTITQATELYTYRSYFEALLTYGSDVAATHLTNAFWYLDEGDLLPCDPTAADEKNNVSITQ